MAFLLNQNPAPGGPGISPRWTRSDKDAIGTAYSASSRVWFAVSKGILDEVYYSHIDRPQIRDLQYLVTDGATFFHDSRRHMDSAHEYLDSSALGFRIISADRQGRYRLIKEVLSDPHQSSVLLHTRFEPAQGLEHQLRLFVLLAPHLEVGGWGNNGNVARTQWGDMLTAHKGSTWLSAAATIPFLRCSCGYVGVNDGWQYLARNFEMDWQYDSALNGNIALTGELDLSKGTEFVLGLAFGSSLHQVLTILAQALAVPFAEHRQRFIDQWQRSTRHMAPGWEPATGDGGKLYRTSHSLMLAHEDKVYSGALIASLSIPWGDAKGDEDVGGYHLVWTRDLCNSATALLAVGDTDTPQRTLIYLACTQRNDGGFYQNFWIDGAPCWRGVQLDEVAFPIMLAWRLRQANPDFEFPSWPMVRKAAAYLILHGPATPQERWEENSGYSPSTLASNIAALICAAAIARQRQDEATAQFLEEYADFLECHIEAWTVTTEGTLLPGIPRHFIRIHPVDVNDPHPDEDPNYGVLPIRNLPQSARAVYPAKEIVDAGFLELVRYGIRKPGDPLIEDSLRVVDAVLKVDTPFGPCWHRYSRDGYGQRPDGGPFVTWGQGRAWPLLTGERGHYELAAGRDVRPYLRAMERFATATCLLAEQIWDAPDLPAAHMFLGKPTGAAMPLLWAHAEYVKLVRSATDGQVFDLIPPVAERYRARRPVKPLEVWKFNRQVSSMRPGQRLRIQTSAPCRLHWTNDEWQHAQDTASTSTALGLDYVDIAVPPEQRAPIRFTFFWTEAKRWEGRDFQVNMCGVV